MYAWMGWDGMECRERRRGANSREKVGWDARRASHRERQAQTEVQARHGGGGSARAGEVGPARTAFACLRFRFRKGGDPLSPDRSHFLGAEEAESPDCLFACPPACAFTI
jgi:hypothetical protein